VRRSLYVLATATVLVVGGVVGWVGVPRFTGSDVASPALSAPKRWSIADARRFEGYPLYWLGDSFQGLPLTRVKRIVGGSGETVAVSYGDCTIPPAAESCPIPLSIYVEPYCQTPPEVVAERVKSGPPVEIRGATVQWTGTDGMMLWTSNVAVSIVGESESLVRKAAENLVRLNGGEPSSPAEDLGPPDNISCPPKPGLIP